LTERINWKDVYKEVIKDDAGKKDFIEPVSDIRMNNDARLVTSSNKEGFELNGWSLGQALGRLRVPGLPRYGRFLYEKGETELLSQQFNRWKKRVEDDDKSWMLRTKRGVCRAVLSNRYSKLDNRFIVSCIRSISREIDLEVVNWNLDDLYMNLRVKLPNMTKNIGTVQTGDEVSVGLHITNSEVGASAVYIHVIVYRLVCSNGLVVGGDESIFQRRHVHIGEQRMRDIVNENISELLDRGKKQIERYAATRDEKVDYPEELIRKLSKRQGYSEDFAETVIQNYREEAEPTKYGVINAYTRAARNLPFERRIEVEKFAGRLLDERI